MDYKMTWVSIWFSNNTGHKGCYLQGGAVNGEDRIRQHTSHTH
jgi:hypothetical protein